MKILPPFFRFFDIWIRILEKSFLRHKTENSFRISPFRLNSDIVLPMISSKFSEITPWRKLLQKITSLTSNLYISWGIWVSWTCKHNSRGQHLHVNETFDADICNYVETVYWRIESKIQSITSRCRLKVSNSEIVNIINTMVFGLQW